MKHADKCWLLATNPPSWVGGPNIPQLCRAAGQEQQTLLNSPDVVTAQRGHHKPTPKVAQSLCPHLCLLHRVLHLLRSCSQSLQAPLLPLLLLLLLLFLLPFDLSHHLVGLRGAEQRSVQGQTPTHPFPAELSDQPH